MPNIREYGSTAVAGRQGLTPNNLGTSAVAEGGRRMAQLAGAAGNAFAELGRSVGEAIQTGGQAAEDYYSKKEVLKFGADSAALTANLMSKWNTTRNTADPNDPTVAQRFNSEVLEPALEDFGKGYQTPTGQRLAVEQRNKLLEHFAVTQQADERTMDAAAAEKNLVTMQNAHASSLAVDPSGLSLANDLVDRTVDEYKKVGGLSAEQNVHLDALKQDMKRTNTLAAFHGMASANPTAAKAALDSGFGKDALKEQDQTTLRNYADEQQRFNDSRDRAAENDRIRKNREAVNTALGDLTADTIRTDGTLAITPEFFNGIKKIGAMPDAEPGAVREAYNWAKSEISRTSGRDMAVADPTTHEEFDRKLGLNDEQGGLTMTEIYKARADGLLSREEFAFYRQGVADTMRDPAKRDAVSQLNNFLKGQKSSITASNPVTGQSFPQQDRRYGDFRFEMQKQFDAVYRAHGDWQALLDPNSPKYLGKQTSTYQIGSKESMKLFRESLQNDKPTQLPPVPAPKPGQGIDDYVDEQAAAALARSQAAKGKK